VKKIKQLGKKTNSTLGALTVVCGFVMMWASSLGGSTTQSSITAALDGAIDIDAGRPSPANNGRLVVASGTLRGDVLLDDEFLLPQPVVRLTRHVEMFQWVENNAQQEAPSNPLSYSLEWVTKEVDFFQFRESAGHENPVMKVQPLDKKSALIFFGGFDGSRIVDAIDGSFPLELTPDKLKDSSQIIQNNKLLIKRDPALKEVSLGDMRVWYDVLPAGDYTVLAEQVDEMSLIGARPKGKLLIQRGRYTADELFELLSQGAKQAYTGMLFLGALLMAFGLVSVLKPYAERIDLNPKLDVKGMPAVMLISVGISTALMGIFMVLALIG
jgi:hypothetical protein